MATASPLSAFLVWRCATGRSSRTSRRHYERNATMPTVDTATARAAALDATIAYSRDTQIHGAARVLSAEVRLPAATAVLIAQQAEMIAELTVTVQELRTSLDFELTTLRETVEMLTGPALPAGAEVES